MEQIKSFIEKAKTDTSLKTGELSEEDLDAVSGGGTQNRYDPKVCPNIGRTRYECVGFLSSCYCDHYSVLTHFPNTWTSIYKHKCAMGAFDYEGDKNGEPKKQGGDLNAPD